ncbi:hypothetical protein NLI96_g10381 [Meripilus lineatus]|uniref:25S rRNA adenine-N(1) methyltransferase n=1 Tax=Meripilus lineatus TaxID=2056292 RepID=A0AAD5YC21_9APHY|nr:hypothetical protein NLI96_g10381 [Physisporinus lineatus]
MPKSKKTVRKSPITAPSAPVRGTNRSPSGTSSNPSATRTLIRRFHVLIKRKAQLKKLLQNGNSSGNHIKAREDLRNIEDEIAGLGGLEVYQRMSSVGQGNDRGGGSEKVFIGWLEEIGEVQRAKDHAQKLQLLEVGALKPDNYSTCSSWVQNSPIDLHSRHPSIKEQDFLRMDEEANREKWDLVSLSLVVNFVPEPRDRGRMLSLAHTAIPLHNEFALPQR